MYTLVKRSYNAPVTQSGYSQDAAARNYPRVPRDSLVQRLAEFFAAYMFTSFARLTRLSFNGMLILARSEKTFK